jgi:hypothetical protein
MQGADVMPTRLRTEAMLGETEMVAKAGDVALQLQSAKQELLDMTMRNKLLRFRPSRNKHVRVASPGPLALFAKLVEKEGQYGLQAGDFPEADSDWIHEEDDNTRGRKNLGLHVDAGLLRDKLLGLEKYYREFLDE